MRKTDPHHSAVFWLDRTFWLAVAVGPLCWSGLWLVTTSQPVWAWPLQQPFTFLQLALLYPLVEEIVFRGLLQDACHRHLPKRALGPISLANLVTSIVFTIVHFLYHAPSWAALVFLPSLVFGYCKDRYNSLIPPILLHVFYNTGYYWVLVPGG